LEPPIIMSGLATWELIYGETIKLMAVFSEWVSGMSFRMTSFSGNPSLSCQSPTELVLSLSALTNGDLLSCPVLYRSFRGRWVRLHYTAHPTTGQRIDGELQFRAPRLSHPHSGQILSTTRFGKILELFSSSVIKWKKNCQIFDTFLQGFS
jgi:hypothetical protein